MPADPRPAPRLAEPSPEAPRVTIRWSKSLVLITALLCGLTVWRFGPTAELPAFLVLAASAAVLTDIDLRHRLLPNRVLLPAFLAGAVLLTLAAALTGEWTALLRAGFGAAALFAVFLVLALISPRSLGMGDVKLAGLIGLYLGWLGWTAVLLGFFLGFLGQALLGLGLIVAGKAGRRTELPFGPALLAGALLVVLLSGAWAGLTGAP